MKEFENIFSLDGKIAIITGGAGGIGKSIARGFCHFGGTSVIVDVDIESGKRTADEIIKDGGKADAFSCDVTNKVQVDETVNAIATKYGKIDILVANAGIGDRNPAEDMTENQWDRVINIDLKGVWLFNQAVGKHMIENSIKGCIINMSSITAIIGIKTGNANYSAAKGGVASLTRTLAVEWSRFGVRVNAIAPAQIKTPLIEEMIEKSPEKGDYFLSRLPLGFGTCEDIAAAAIYLAAGSGKWLSGHLLTIDGGTTIMY